MGGDGGGVCRLIGAGDAGFLCAGKQVVVHAGYRVRLRGILFQHGAGKGLHRVAGINKGEGEAGFFVEQSGQRRAGPPFGHERIVGVHQYFVLARRILCISLCTAKTSD